MGAPACLLQAGAEIYEYGPTMYHCKVMIVDQLLVSVGYGHAFLVLSEAAEVQYKCSTFYAPQSEGTVAWNDPEIAVPWPFPEPLVSARDGQGMTLAAYRERPAFHWQPSAATQSR